MTSPHSIFTVPNDPKSKQPSSPGGSIAAPSSTASNRPSAHELSRSLAPAVVHSAFHTSPRTALPSASDSLQNLKWKSGGKLEGRPTSTKRDHSNHTSNAHESGAVTTPTFVKGIKRSLPADFPELPLPTKQPAHKKARVQIGPRHTIDPSRTSHPPLRALEPPSPLFFSHNPRRRPNLPPRFSSSEAEATMLRNASLEDSGGIRTVKMARGPRNMGTGSPPPRRGSPIGRPSSGRSSLSLPSGPTSEEQGTPGNLDALNQVGIVELLERDERPTFILDLHNQTNYRPGPLQIEFANSSLRAYSGLLDLIIGKFVEESPSLGSTVTFPEFKAWTTSFVKNNESLDVCLPSFLYGGIVWSCSTLRKRFRFISGGSAPGPGSINSNPPSIGTPGLSFTALSHPGVEQGKELENTRAAQDEEPSDYFGNAQFSHKSPKPRSVRRTMEAPDQTDSSGNHETPRANGLELVGVDLGGHRPSPLENTSNKAALLGAATASELDSFKLPETLDQGFFDWTRLPVSPAMPRHVQFARSVDWASTSLGPIENWPAALRSMCNLIMASPHPAAMYWGDDFVAIYNEAYILLAGQKHPDLMGKRYSEAWAEIWDDIRGVFASAKMTGQATMKDDDCLFLKRNGYLEECYFSWSIIPLVGDDGSVVGLYNPAFEKTRRKIAERRMLTLREVGEKIAAAREITGFWGQVLEGLEFNERDTPFVLLYSVAEDFDSDVSSIHSTSTAGTKLCVLEGTLPSIPEGHRAAPAQIDLKAGWEGFAPYFREALATDRPILLETEKGTLDVDLIEGIEWRGFGEMPRAAVVCPIHPTLGDSSSSLGFLVMGINPRPYDDDYDLFVQLLSRQLATSMASVVLFEEEIRRGQRAAKMAALDRIELAEQLAARTQEARESETKFTRMAEFAPVGMFIANSEGRITYCNDMFYEISRHPKEVDNADDWVQAVKDEDRGLVSEWWTNLVVNKVPMTAEFRFKAPWEDRNGSKGDTWVLASAYPEKDSLGVLKSVFGSITDISQQKWAEDFQKRRMEEAVELKRTQERFIDTTSHEMRNPLSAIVQCADEISTSLTNYRAANNRKTSLPLALLDSNIDAAQIIALCANHQTRIVTDILTLSKLDSALLLVTPVNTKPVSVVQQTLKMFQGELQTAGIQMQVRTDSSWENMKLDWVKVDPSRLMQVLINLTTNAIKFTTGQPTRNIIITLSASSERPSSKAKSLVSYIPARSKDEEITKGADWGTGDEVYIHFAVQDTGRGLNDSEKKLLFLRFSQASPRTHVQYGGSGLGLFISRELVELQGGEIGVSSESGKGSTFAFFVKARTCTEPIEEKDQLASAKMPTGTSYMTSPRLKAASPSDITKARLPSMSDNQLRVLIVEDNLVNQKVLQKQLRNLGCVVHVANHGGECIDRLKESRFWVNHEDHGLDLSVILMDLEMPVMDGLTCTRKIRQLEKEGDIVRHVPIIAVTANARLEQINTAVEAGMDDVVSKPFRIPELIPKIEQLVAKFKSAA